MSAIAQSRCGASLFFPTPVQSHADLSERKHFNKNYVIDSIMHLAGPDPVEHRPTSNSSAHTTTRQRTMDTYMMHSNAQAHKTRFGY